MRKFLITPFILLLAACGGGGGGGDLPATRATTVISGVAFDGLILNGDVSVFAFNDGVKGELLGSGMTNSRGEYTISFKANDRPIIIEVSGGRYVEEASAKSVPLQQDDVLRAVMNHRSGVPLTMAMTYYSNLAAGLSSYLISTGMNASTAINVANRRMSDLIGLDITQTVPVDVTILDNASAVLTDSLRYGFATASISAWTVWANEQNNLDPHELYTSINFAKRAYDDILYDGQLDGHGIKGPVSVGVVPLSSKTYRTELARNILVIAGNPKNVTGFSATDLVELAQLVASSGDDIFVGSPVDINTDAPVISNVTPAGNELVTGTIQVAADVTDLIGLSTVVFKVDGADHETVYVAQASTFIDTLTLADGNHVISVVATNILGAESQYDFTLLVSNAGITISNITPQNDTYVRGTELRISADVTDPIGLTEVLFQIDYLPPVTAEIVNGVANKSFVFDTTSLVDGSHSLTITATNTALNSDSVIMQYNIDNSAPVPELTIGDDAIIGGLFNVKGNTSDLLALSSSALFFSGSKVSEWADISILSYLLDTTTFTDGEHLMVLESRDVAGNVAVDSRLVTVDNTAPSIAIVSPLPNIVVGGSFIVNGSITDNLSAVGKVELQIDSVLYETQSNTNSPSFTVDSSAFDEGSHSVTLIAADAVGNSSSTTVSNILVDLTPPTLALDANLEGKVVSGTISISGNISDQYGLANAALSVGSSQVQSWAFDSPIFYNLNTATFADGDLAITLNAVDNVGNVSSEVTRNIVVDNTPPVITISSPQNGDFINSSFYVRGIATDATSGIGDTVYNDPYDGSQFTTDVEVLVDGVHYDGAGLSSGNSFAQEININVLSEGAHTITVKVTDIAGHISSETVSIVIDKSAPSISYSLYKVGYAFYANLSVSDLSLKSVTMDGMVHNVPNGMTSYNTSTFVYMGNSRTSKRFRIVATDKMGNSTTRTIHCNGYRCR